MFTGPLGRLLTVLAFLGLSLGVFLFLFSGTGVHIPLIQPAQYQLTAEFADADNLVQASRVEMAGVPVGDVRSVVRRNGLATVVFAVDSDNAPLHQGATIRLGARSLVEESYLDITDGAGPVLADGTVLPSAAVRPSVQLDDVIGSLDPATRAAASSLIRELRPATVGTQPDVAATLSGLGDLGRNGATALDAIAAQSRDLQSLSVNLTTLLGALDTGEGQIAGLVTDAQRLTAATSSRQEAVADTMRRLPGVLDRTTASADGVTRIADALAPVAANLKDASPFLSTALTQLPGTTADLRGLLPSLSGVLDRAPATLTRVPTLGGDVRAVVPPAQTMLADLNPALAYLSPYGRDFAGYLANFNSVLQYTDEKGAHYIRLLPVVDERAQSPVPLQITGYSNPYPAPGAGSLPGPFAGAYPRVERAPR
jgi:phospholipid/cholesterol/gamma-HCH transport system substrate-binding protein